MNNLLESLRGVLDTKKSNARKTYIDIIRRADKPKPNDPEQLSAALADLGLTPQHFEADLGAIRNAVELERRIPDPKLLANRRRDAERLDAQRSADLRKARADREAAMAAFRDACGREEAAKKLIISAPERTAVEQAEAEADDLRHRLADLKAAHPLAFAAN